MQIVADHREVLAAGVAHADAVEKPATQQQVVDGLPGAPIAVAPLGSPAGAAVVVPPPEQRQPRRRRRHCRGHRQRSSSRGLRGHQRRQVAPSAMLVLIYRHVQIAGHDHVGLRVGEVDLPQPRRQCRRRQAPVALGLGGSSVAGRESDATAAPAEPRPRVRQPCARAAWRAPPGRWPSAGLAATPRAGTRAATGPDSPDAARHRRARHSCSATRSAPAGEFRSRRRTVSDSRPVAHGADSR